MLSPVVIDIVVPVAMTRLSLLRSRGRNQRPKQVQSLRLSLLRNRDRNQHPKQPRAYAFSNDGDISGTTRSGGGGGGATTERKSDSEDGWKRTIVQHCSIRFNIHVLNHVVTSLPVLTCFQAPRNRHHCHQKQQHQCQKIFSPSKDDSFDSVNLSSRMERHQERRHNDHGAGLQWRFALVGRSFFCPGTEGTLNVL